MEKTYVRIKVDGKRTELRPIGWRARVIVLFCEKLFQSIAGNIPDIPMVGRVPDDWQDEYVSEQVYNRLQPRVKDKQEGAMCVHCNAHNMNLAFHDAVTKVNLCRGAMKTVKEQQGPVSR